MTEKFGLAWGDFKKVIENPDNYMLRGEYCEYCGKYYKWDRKDGAVMSFSDWWRAMADNAKDNREGK